MTTKPTISEKDKRNTQNPGNREEDRRQKTKSGDNKNSPTCFTTKADICVEWRRHRGELGPVYNIYHNIYIVSMTTRSLPYPCCPLGHGLYSQWSRGHRYDTGSDHSGSRSCGRRGIEREERRSTDIRESGTRAKTLNTFGVPRQNGRHFADDNIKCIFLNENVLISINVSLKFVPKGQINNNPALVQIMAWRRPGDKS